MQSYAEYRVQMSQALLARLTARVEMTSVLPEMCRGCSARERIGGVGGSKQLAPVQFDAIDGWNLESEIRGVSLCARGALSI